jgi:recombination protein RecT
MVEVKKDTKANPGTEIAKKEAPKLSASERFTNKILAEFGSGVGHIALTEFQKRLAQNYFISIDAGLKAAEVKRLVKTKGQDPLPVTWENVNMESLARNVVAYARIGLDPAQKNHINMMPFKNNATKKYDIGFIEGYRGLELKAVKYGLDVPEAVIVELVYTNDKFKPIKKSMSNTYESYEFEIVDAFDRGTIKGGFYYHVYPKFPEKNKLVIMTLKDIEKRKPKYASVEFWGGEKDVWENGKKVGKEQVEGWYEKMCYKTIYRAAYSDMTIDSQKIDDDYLRLKQAETEFSEAEVEETINQHANKEYIDIEPSQVDVEPEPEPEPEHEHEREREPEQQQITIEEGPGY